MGSFTDGTVPEIELRNLSVATSDTPMKTDVDGVESNGTKDGLYVFDVSKEDFFNNMKLDRKRTRFSNSSPASQYLRNTKYKNPFYIRYKDENGEVYIRKIK